MAITDKYDDGQVQSALQERIIIDETPIEVADIKSDLRIDNADGNIISVSCILETVDNDNEEYSISADYTLKIDENGETISLEYSNYEMN